MMFVKYSILAVINIILMVINAACSPLIALFINRNGYLPSWLSWFQTADNPAIGDAIYGNKEAAFTAKYPRWLAYYIRGVMWGCRNPAYGFSNATGLTINLDVFFMPYKVVGDENVDIGFDEATQKPIYTLGTVYRTLWNGDGKQYFDWKHAGRWSANYGFMVRFGWNLDPALLNGQRRSLYVDVRPRIALT